MRTSAIPGLAELNKGRSADRDDSVFATRWLSGSLALLTPPRVERAGEVVPQLARALLDSADLFAHVLVDLTGFELLGEHASAAACMDAVALVGRAHKTQRAQNCSRLAQPHAPGTIPRSPVARIGGRSMLARQCHSIKEKIAVIGLGYVGLPVAISFGKKPHTVGFDIRQRRIDELKKGHDDTHGGDVGPARRREAARASPRIPSRLAECTFYIVAVPTPIDQHNRPDLGPMISASKTVGPHLRKGDIVVFESTVYPGVTEDICGPVLDEKSGLKNGVDYFLGYSPERIKSG